MNIREIALKLGYPIIDRVGRFDQGGRVWLSRFTKTRDRSRLGVWIGLYCEQLIIESEGYEYEYASD